MSTQKFKATIRQHHVYRKYLSAWTPTLSTKGKIWCFHKEEKNTFQSSLFGIGQERYFYEMKKLTEIEKLFIFILSKYQNSSLQKLNPLFVLQKISEIEELENQHRKCGENNNNIIEKTFQDYSPELYIELRRQIGEYQQGIFESIGVKYLERLVSGNYTFFDNKEKQFDFIAYLVMQYIRTRSMRNRLKRAFSDLSEKKNFFTENIIPCKEKLLSLDIPFDINVAIKQLENISDNINYEHVHAYLLFSNVTELCHIFTVIKKPTLHFLISPKETPFITADQPVINVYADPENISEPKDAALYYPVSPAFAIIINFSDQTYPSDSSNCSTETVKNYNEKIIQFAESQVYAISKEHLVDNGLTTI